MDYICKLTKEELQVISEDDLRIEIYKISKKLMDDSECIEDLLTEEKLTKIKEHLSNHGLTLKFSQFLQEYPREISRFKMARENKIKYKILKKKEEEDKIKWKKEEEERLETARKNSLKYWLENYPERFEDAIFTIGNMCLQTYPCKHGTKLKYVDEEGKNVEQPFLAGGCTILELLKKYPNMKGVTDNDKDHFKKYED